jgi:type I restriction enzyme S subunit
VTRPVALKHLVQFIAGQSPPSDDVDDYDGEGLPFLQGNAEFGSIHPQPVHRCDRASRRCTTGDILLSIRAPVGALNKADRSYGIGRGLCAVRGVVVDPPFLWWLLHAEVNRLLSIAVGSMYDAVTSEDIGSLRVSVPVLTTQRAIADYLDTETARIDTLIEKKRRLVALMEERAESAIHEHIACSGLVSASGSSILMKRALIKHERPADAGEMVTAYRDGQVTARSSRRSDGYTEAWTEGAVVQGVRRGDVVIHGLDGFAGAIGTSEVDGICSPVYHVCSPAAGGDPVYFGRLLRILAVSGYLGLFASSTRERAVDFRNWELFGRIPIPEVPLAEQRKVASYIRRIGPLKDVVDRSVQLATEYRKALITNAVTGQIAIPGVAA